MLLGLSMAAMTVDPEDTSAQETPSAVADAGTTVCPVSPSPVLRLGVSLTSAADAAAAAAILRFCAATAAAFATVAATTAACFNLSVAAAKTSSFSAATAGSTEGVGTGGVGDAFACTGSAGGITKKEGSTGASPCPRLRSAVTRVASGECSRRTPAWLSEGGGSCCTAARRWLGLSSSFWSCPCLWPVSPSALWLLPWSQQSHELGLLSLPWLPLRLLFCPTATGRLTSFTSASKNRCCLELNK
mmetsp:Transcript_117762/g.328006  ORF Transcript_117762/g.328006 Transcript_117762/m.328006 type:complete len:245 (+) Transcript_117762:879-1613(+)